MIALKSFIRLIRRALRPLSDPVLGWTIAVASLLVLNGLWWGWFESWDPDQVALRPVLLSNRPPLEPADFVKAPFHAYLNFFLSVLPLKVLERVAEAVSGASLSFNVAILWWSRFIQLALFLGAVVCAYRIVDKAYGRWAARLVAVVMATSAGFVLKAHYLTEDIPVAFWMLASFLVAQSIVVTGGRMRDYALAGMVAGVAAATKYNGLVVGLAIPIFHYFANHTLRLKRVATDVRLLIGVASVVVGFVATNPYSVLDFTRFSADAVYGFQTLSFYHTEVGNLNHLLLPLQIVENLGWPIALIAAVAAAVAPALVRRSVPVEGATLVAALAVFASYALIPVRFLLPAVPFFLIAGGAFAARLVRSPSLLRHAATVAVGGGLAYNVVASVWVGQTFASDPRLAAQSWVESHVAPGSEIESTAFSPDWNASPGIAIKDVRMPFVTGRNRLFSKLYSDKAGVVTTLDRRESDSDVGWYNAEALQSRQPDYIVLDWLYYGRFLVEPVGPLYPEIGGYFAKLLKGQLGYVIVFDQSLRRPPDWLYPRDIGFVELRTVILKRSVRGNHEIRATAEPRRDAWRGLVRTKDL